MWSAHRCAPRCWVTGQGSVVGSPMSPAQFSWLAVFGKNLVERRDELLRGDAQGEQFSDVGQHGRDYAAREVLVPVVLEIGGVLGKAVKAKQYGTTCVVRQVLGIVDVNWEVPVFLQVVQVPSRRGGYVLQEGDRLGLLCWRGVLGDRVISGGLTDELGVEPAAGHGWEGREVVAA